MKRFYPERAAGGAIVFSDNGGTISLNGRALARPWQSVSYVVAAPCIIAADFLLRVALAIFRETPCYYFVESSTNTQTCTSG